MDMGIPLKFAAAQVRRRARRWQVPLALAISTLLLADMRAAASEDGD
jgi:hypothetical protein